MTSPAPQPPHLISALERLDDLDVDGHSPAPDPEPEAPARRQPGQLIEVFVAGADPYPFTVRILNRDRIAYEKAAARHTEWPEKGRSFVMAFLTWSAARREQLTALSFEAWQTALEDWDGVQETPADPTR
jgi:hypothetical protein